MTLAINPETKVGALLDAYPALEGVLIRLAPAFEKLRNPVLRKTVAKVATLEQAARIGGVELPRLVAELRKAAGQPDDAPVCAAASADAGPAWLAAAPVAVDIDADVMLERGVHPVGKVKESVAALAPGEVVRLRTSFRPEPLIELMRRTGAQVYSAETAPGRHTT